MQYLIAQIERFAPASKHASGSQPLKVIAMIENARGMMELKEIVREGKGYIDGLLVSRWYELMAMTDGSLLLRTVSFPLSFDRSS